MFGFAFGLFCLWGLVRVLRHGRGYSSRGCGNRRGRWSRGRSWRGPRSMFMNRLFEELDTTPGQEKEIRAAVEEVFDAGHKVKAGMHDIRRDVGEVFRSDELDASLMGDILSKQDDAVDEVRQAMAGGLARIHTALDPEQRARLARWLERGSHFGRRGFGGPYRARG
jgi:Spy/CpxP family protein refolding chaperone